MYKKGKMDSCLSKYKCVNNNQFSNDQEVVSTFKNFFAVLDFLKEKGLNIVVYTPPYFEVMQLYDNRYAYVPRPSWPLYRGQNNYYEPCISSLSRLSDKNWITHFENKIRIEEFKSILEDNPEIVELKEGGFQINYLGLAQHYGLCTNLLDWTNSAFVAGFFATHDYDYLADRYIPIIDNNRVGVLYFNLLGGLLETANENKIWPVGMEALKRPGEQRAYSMELLESEDMNTRPGIEKFLFFQDQQISFSLYNFFKLGTALFPYDPMAEKVRMMKKLRVYCNLSFQTAFNASEFNPNDYNKIKTSLESDGIRFFEKSLFDYTKSEKEYIQDEYRKKFPNN